MSKQSAALKRLIRQIVREELKKTKASQPEEGFGEPQLVAPHNPWGGPPIQEPEFGPDPMMEDGSHPFEPPHRRRNQFD